MNQYAADNDPPTVLHYAAPLTIPTRRFVWPVVLGILQFPWIAAFVFESLFWGGRPVEPVKDSIIQLVIFSPSMAAMWLSFRYCRLRGSGRRTGSGLVVCLLVLLLSTAIVAWDVYQWIDFLRSGQKRYDSL